MMSLKQRNCAQEEGRGWERGRNSRWRRGLDGQLAGPQGWFRVFWKAVGSGEVIKMQGDLRTGALAWRGLGNSGTHRSPRRSSTDGPRHPPTPSSRHSAAFSPNTAPERKARGSGRGLGVVRPSLL